MRICIFGAGAVGSHFAVRLALAGHDVSCVMRGPHLAAVQAKGLTLRVAGAEFSARVKASDDPAVLGPQDVVISTLKANGLSSLATGLPPLLRDDTSVVFAQNGIPWWYDIGLPRDQPPPPDLGFLDPGGRLRSAISKDRIIGGVIFSSNEIVSPGLVVNDSPERNMLITGECDDRPSARIETLRAALVEAGIQSPPAPRIREAIWTKLTSNMSVSVLCAVTGKTAKASTEDPALRDVVQRLLDEGQAVARSCYPEVKRRTGPAPDHKPSLLQDFERGRPMEIDALVTAPAAFARAAGLSTPMLDMLAGLAIRKARGQGAVSGVSGLHEFGLAGSADSLHLSRLRGSIGRLRRPFLRMTPKRSFGYVASQMRFGWGKSINATLAFRSGTPTPTHPRKREREFAAVAEASSQCFNSNESNFVQ